MLTRPPSSEYDLVRWIPFVPSCTPLRPPPMASQAHAEPRTPPLWQEPRGCRHHSGFRLDEGRGLPFTANPTLAGDQ